MAISGKREVPGRLFQESDASTCGSRPRVPLPTNRRVNRAKPRKQGALTRSAASGMFTQERLHRLRRAVQPALRIDHAKSMQKVGLQLAFHAFGNHGKTERPRWWLIRYRWIR